MPNPSLYVNVLTSKALCHSLIWQNLSPFPNCLFCSFSSSGPCFLFYGFFSRLCWSFIRPISSLLPPVVIPPVLWLLPIPVEPPPGKAGSGPAAGQGAAAGREPGPVPRGGQALAVLQPVTHRRPLNYVSVLNHLPLPTPFFFFSCLMLSLPHTQAGSLVAALPPLTV